MTNNEVYFQTTLTTDDDGSASTVIHSQRDDAPGEYRVQASVAEGTSASTSFQILSSEQAEERSAPGPLYSDATAIQNGEWVGETTTESGVIAYSFSANSGDILDAQLSSEVFDAYLVLLNSAGAELTMDDDSGPDLNAHISEYTLPETGEYTLLATSWRFYHLGEALPPANSGWTSSSIQMLSPHHHQKPHPLRVRSLNRTAKENSKPKSQLRFPKQNPSCALPSAPSLDRAYPCGSVPMNSTPI